MQYAAVQVMLNAAATTLQVTAPANALSARAIHRFFGLTVLKESILKKSAQ